MCEGSEAKWFIKKDYGQKVKIVCKVCGDFKVLDKPVTRSILTGELKNNKV